MRTDKTDARPAPLDETERLKRLADLALMAEPAAPEFDKICDLAATILRVPYAFVSLIDRTEAHVFAHHGLGFGRMPRRQAMCDVTIDQGSPLVVPDLTADPRFSDAPLVAGDAAMRAYAGVPVELAPGVRVGSFCVADRTRRDFDQDDIAELEGLSALVVEQIEHHARRQSLGRLALQLAGRQAILDQTEHLAQVGGFELDSTSGIMQWSDGLRRLLRAAADEPPTLAGFLARFADRDAGLAAALSSLADGSVIDLERPFAPATNQRVGLVHAERTIVDGGTGKIIGIVQDITDRKRALADLEWTAAHDALTGLFNRAAFTAAVDDAMRAIPAEGVALIMVDVDRFKLVNDTLGHDVGDDVLRATTRRLCDVIGKRGIVGRIGGDEFAVLVRDMDTASAAAELATRLLLALRRPLHHRSGDLATRATLGVAMRGQGVEDVGTLFKAADLALYSAKEAGRDGFAFFQSTMREETIRKLERLDAARDAVDASRIEPYYQPKIALDTGRIVGFEALLRWHHPSRGLCLPGEIGEAFADPGLATDIGALMLRRAMSDMVGWRGCGVAFGHVAINVSEAELSGGDYAERLLSCLAANRLGTDQIEIEVTESVFLGQTSSHAARRLTDLAAAGLAIALDDFGTGFASLTHLKNYPVSTIKIDRSFVTDIESDRHDAMIVEALTKLAQGLGIAVVAEGIETAAQAQHLRRLRCTMGQGYLFAKPMPASRVPHFVRTWNARLAQAPVRAAG